MRAPRLRHNIAALGTLQVASYAVGFATLPYITRVLGPDQWGRVAFAQIVLNYLMWVTNWGFHLSASRNIAVNRDDPARRDRTFVATWAAQWMLAALCLLALLFAVLLVPALRHDAALYACGAGLILGNVLFPTWFLVGMERMREMAVVQLAIKLPTIPAVFLFVHDSQDGPAYLAVHAITGVIGGAVGVLWMVRSCGVSFSAPAAADLWKEVREGAALFASSTVATLTSTATPALLGVVGGPAALGLYALADRINRAALACLSPIISALFPRMCNVLHRDPAEARTLLIRSVIAVGGLAATASIVIYAFARPIVAVLGGPEFVGSAEVLRWLAPIVAISSISMLLGLQVLVPTNRVRPYFWSYILGGAVALALLVPLVRWRGAAGGAMATLVAELAVAAFIAWHACRAAPRESPEKQARTSPTPGAAGAA